MNARRLSRWVLGGLAGAEAVAYAARQRSRSALYRAAESRARCLGRTFVVVGDPDAGATRGPGYGDVCMDLTGCPLAPAGVGVAADITKHTGIPDDSAVVFVSCVLEYVNDGGAAVREVFRMAGSADNVFLALVQPWTATAHLYPGSRNTVSVHPLAGGELVRVRPISTPSRVLYGGALAALAWTALAPRRWVPWA